MLENKLPVIGSRGKEWQPLINYKTSLKAARAVRKAPGSDVADETEEDNRQQPGDERAEQPAVGKKKQITLRKTPLNVKKVRGPRARVTVEEETAEEVHSVSQDIDNRLKRMGVNEDAGVQQSDAEEERTMDEQMEVN